ncbi:helix-turn-helix transcriptional regulator [Halomonas sp. 1390]|uniref:helix-turn-helix transcriptional regulator n=1 Tax=Halomonas sp. B23F22_3 TaxID=3459516 RepID=UPI00373F37BE
MDIRSLRAKAGMTQKELGEACGLGQSTIGNYEAGIRAPSLEVAQKIIEAVRSRGVDVSIEDLFTAAAAA